MKKKIINISLIIVGVLIVSIVGTKAATSIQSSMVTYNNTTVKETLDDLIDMSIKGNATSEDITAGKTAVVQGKLVTGTKEEQKNEKGMYVLHQTDSQVMSYTFEEDLPMGVLVLWYAQSGADAIQDTTVNISSGSQTVLINKTSYALLSYTGYTSRKTWSRCKVILLTNIPKGATITTECATNHSQYGATATILKPYENNFSKMEVLNDSNSNISSYTFNNKTPYALVIEWNGQKGSDYTNDTHVILSSGTQETLIDKKSYMVVSVGTQQKSWSRFQTVLLTNIPEGATLNSKCLYDYSSVGATTTILVPV